ncbi:DUF4150 domain-containing protein [Pseudomonas chlororaphis]|uniref:DUF4150 domain-containing protein n=1 Tax=Pseudomonas chlororaphis TaxID=587753 RepID=UPI002368ADB4|nr:DUF4150 domain-containing protein [Pseudomonas chlororaphis]WDH32964.1 DUF4150 domain-containing protein [Pseudomonas chlororaphis]WDH39046.1 DUF4150 domain-containing protein [Pseudomonas chlororaphis]
MGCKVYANGDEIACKAGDGKVIAAFPDVCLTPPAPPAGPIPVPYPDTSFSKDMKKGSKTVKIKRKEVMLKDLSYYKTSPLGDETATKSQGAGVITHVITGKTYFVSWSMDVLFEGQNVDRHTDITTSNHASPMANASTPTINIAFAAPPDTTPFQGECKCCGEFHAGQQGGVEVSEDVWYGLNEGQDIESEFNTMDDPHPQNKNEQRKTARNLKKLIEREPKLEQRKAAVSLARELECKSLPEHPCNTYYIFPQTTEDTDKHKTMRSKRTSEIDDAWNSYRKEYKEKNDLPETVEHRGKVKENKINHRVPKAAGGCPTGDNNLVPDSKLSSECRDADEQLSFAQTDAANRWDETFKPKNS